MIQAYLDLTIAGDKCRALRNAGALTGGPPGVATRDGWGKRVCLVTTSKHSKSVDRCCVHRYKVSGEKVCCQCGVPFEDSIYEPFEEDQLPNDIRILFCDDDGICTDDIEATDDAGLIAWLHSRYGEG